MYCQLLKHRISSSMCHFFGPNFLSLSEFWLTFKPLSGFPAQSTWTSGSAMVAWGYFSLANILFSCRIFKIVLSSSDRAPEIDSHSEICLISLRLTCAFRSSLSMRWSYVDFDVSSLCGSAGFSPLLFRARVFLAELEGSIGTSPPPACEVCARVFCEFLVLASWPSNTWLGLLVASGAKRAWHTSLFLWTVLSAFTKLLVTYLTVRRVCSELLSDVI